MKTLFPLILFLVLLTSCQNISSSPVENFGLHYQQHKDLKSLQKVVDLVELNSDTSLIKKILGAPIDMGFDYRYLVDSVGENGCVIGAVFHINEVGRIDQKWIDEICE